MVASGVWAGDIPLEKAHGLREVMIEQGPRLEAENHKIGVVQGVQAYRWYTITIKGQDCHTGTTDFANRADALFTAAKMMLHSRSLAISRKALASTGIIKVAPGSTNTVPGWVQFSLDIRAAEDDILMGMEQQLMYDFDWIAKGTPVDGLPEGGIKGRPCTVEWTLDSPSAATKFDRSCIDCVRQGAKGLLGNKSAYLVQDMTSGAAEYCAPEDCANGTQVLMNAMLQFDKLRREALQG
ncbi:MAG: hypothetical protein Q9174_001083 [Haloplaca sp. 1 TL-2023]